MNAERATPVTPVPSTMPLIKNFLNLLSYLVRLISLCSPAFVGADLKTETNNGEHHTSEISMKQLVLRRGQSFKLAIKLAQPFEPNCFPLNMRAQTGWCSSFSDGTTEPNSLTDQNNWESDMPWPTYIARQRISFYGMPNYV